MIKVAYRVLLTITLSMISISSGFCMEALVDFVAERLGKKVIRAAQRTGMGNTKGRPTAKVISSQPGSNADLAEKYYQDAIYHLQRVTNKTSEINHEKEGVALLEKAAVMGSIEAETIALTFGYARDVNQNGGNRVLVWWEDND